MKKAGRVVLFALAGVVGLAIVILLAVNLYVQSQGTQARIQQELSQRLGTTLRIQRISVTPWGGLKLSGITIPQAAGAPGPTFLEAKTFRLRIRFRSLFQQRLVIKEISLVSPKVVWVQNSEGKWRLPPPEQIASAPAPQMPAPPAAPRREAAPQASSAPPPPSAPAPADSGDHSFVPEIRRVNLLGGDFHFLDGRGKVVAKFEDVQFHSNFRNAADVRGNLTIAKTSLRDRFFLRDLQSRLSYGPAALEISDVKAVAGAGEITGHFDLRPQVADSPFTANVKFHQVEADRIVSDAGGAAGMISGRLEGYLDANGKTADPNALAGSGEIVLRDGQLRQYSLLEAIGQILQIDELRQLRLDEAHVKYHIQPGVVMIDDMLLHSANIRLAATGSITFDGRLHLDSRLAISEQVRKQLFRAIRDNFQPIDEPGFAAVQFSIGGTVDRPKTDLIDKIVGRDLKDIGSVINKFLGGKEERPKKEKRTEPPQSAPAQPPNSEPPATASPQASPAA